MPESNKDDYTEFWKKQMDFIVNTDNAYVYVSNTKSPSKASSVTFIKSNNDDEKHELPLIDRYHPSVVKLSPISRPTGADVVPRELHHRFINKIEKLIKRGKTIPAKNNAILVDFLPVSKICKFVPSVSDNVLGFTRMIKIHDAITLLHEWQDVFFSSLRTEYRLNPKYTSGIVFGNDNMVSIGQGSSSSAMMFSDHSHNVMRCGFTNTGSWAEYVLVSRFVPATVQVIDAVNVDSDVGGSETFLMFECLSSPKLYGPDDSHFYHWYKCVLFVWLSMLTAQNFVGIRDLIEWNMKRKHVMCRRHTQKTTYSFKHIGEMMGFAELSITFEAGSIVPVLIDSERAFDPMSKETMAKKNRFNLITSTTYFSGTFLAASRPQPYKHTSLDFAQEVTYMLFQESPPGTLADGAVINELPEFYQDFVDSNERLEDYPLLHARAMIEGICIHDDATLLHAVSQVPSLSLNEYMSRAKMNVTLEHAKIIDFPWIVERNDDDIDDIDESQFADWSDE
jgi:hypothetical protein